jgi:hypothetical protein
LNFVRKWSQRSVVVALTTNSSRRQPVVVEQPPAKRIQNLTSTKGPRSTIAHWIESTSYRFSLSHATQVPVLSLVLLRSLFVDVDAYMTTCCRLEYPSSARTFACQAVTLIYVARVLTGSIHSILLWVLYCGSDSSTAKYLYLEALPQVLLHTKNSETFLFARARSPPTWQGISTGTGLEIVLVVTAAEIVALRCFQW